MSTLADCDMTERSDRLASAFRALKIRQSQAVERFGFNRNTFKSNLSGASDFGYNMAKDYARAFRVRAEWLYDGAGAMQEIPRAKERPSRDLPLISWVSAGRIADIGDLPIDAEMITVADLPDGDWFATKVEGDSMDRISPEGSRIIVNARDRELRSGRLYLFSLRGETTYKRYEGEPVRRLEPFSTNPANRTIFLEEPGWEVIGRVRCSYIDV